MTHPLTLTLLGTFHVQHASATLSEFHSNSVRALLAYLAVEADRPHERKLLGELLWPDEPEAKGLLNLRQALYRLDQAIAPAALPVPFTQTTRQTVQMNPALPLTLDVRQFLTLIAAARTHHHRRLTVCSPCLAALRQAVDLYRGDFLAGFSTSTPFDEWRLTWSDRLHTHMVWALDTLAAHHAERGEWELACGYLRHWLEREPWQEDAHRRLMLALSSAGQRSAALAQYEQCCRILARDLDTVPEPRTTSLAARLRVSNPVAWFAPPYVVPAVETPIMGRATALAAIAAQLAAPVGRMLTLVGSGGSGKTRLALAAAAAERGAFRGGVFFVSLVPVTDEGGLIAAIAERLGIPVSVGQSPTLALLTTFLEESEVLLVLDNFEPLIVHAPLLSTLRNSAPNLRILVTSRIPLQILSEVVLHVEGLEPTAVAGDSEPEDDPAVELFMHAARRSAPDFAPSTAEIMAISLLCQTFGRLPLAILLAAGLVAQLSPSDILALVHADLDALESDLRDLPERHRSIRKLFESSWHLLPTEQQQLLAHCALFAASFTRAAVVAVVTDRTSGSRMLDLRIGRSLAALADHSLLQRISSERYVLHPLVRQFATEHHALLPPAIQATSRARHRAYFLGLVAQHADAIIGTAGHAVVELLHTELADIRLAWQNASQTNDIALMGTAVQGLLDLVRSGELYATSTFTFAPAIAELRAPGADDDLARQLLGRLLVAHAETSTLRGDYDDATGAVQEIIQMSYALGQPYLEAEARCVWGKSLRYQGKNQAAQDQLEAAYRLVRASADSRVQRRLRCDIHNFLGLTAWNLGHFGGARAHYRAALRLAQSITYSHSESYGYYALAMTTIMQGNYAEAIEHGTAAITRARVNGSRTTEILGLLSVGLAHMHQGEEAAAQEVFNTCESLLQMVGYRQAESIMIVFRGMLLLRLGDYAAAQATLAEGLALGRMLKYHLSFSLGLNLMGMLHHLSGDQAGAITACREAMVIAERASDIVMVAYALTILGHALAAMGDVTEATACYERTIAIRRAISQVHLVPEPLAGLIELALARGDLPTALAHSETILATYALTHLAGTEEPSRIILACYRSLLVAKDTRATPLLLQAAQQLRERAARLTNPDQQATLCEVVVANRTLLALAEGLGH